MTTLPTRAQIDRAAPLDFEEKRSDKQANIQIQVSPAGLTIVVEYTGAVSSIEAALERLRKAGIMDAVQASKPAAPVAPEKRTRVETVTPLYKPDGTPCCPTHKRELSEGRYGLFCSAKAKPGEPQNSKGYCALRFAE